MLHRLRVTVRQVTEETAGVVERWFESERDAEVWGGELGCGRRGWHGQGWLGNGNWRVTRMQMDEMGVCLSCGEKLVSIDIDPKETENFTASLTNLVCQREVEADFMQFQLNSIVNQLHQMRPSKRLLLLVLHKSHVTGGPAQSHNNKKLLENWKRSGALYATPAGSNDDCVWIVGLYGGSAFPSASHR
ncbi:hypothetical protein HYC85_025822 [Camellia sinensis]|uniref:ribonuclease P n=1 Tax=Camellia sinensis TaxID=4442 RepID=A0A7J7G1U9_CAMSI|nr:hypothetical protein HYC85_025822 [Camellia sinensis]